MSAEYDDSGYIYRGRVIGPDPGRAPDGAWSCPVCAALVIDTDRSTHESWHDLRDEEMSRLYEKD